jgi:hypothetical protein
MSWALFQGLVESVTPAAADLVSICQAGYAIRQANQGWDQGKEGLTQEQDLHLKAIEQGKESLTQEKKLHDEAIKQGKESLTQEQKLHDEAIKQGKESLTQEQKLHDEAIKQGKESLIQEKNLHREATHHGNECFDLDTKLEEIANKAEHARDELALKSAECNTYMVIDTLMIGCAIALMVEGKLAQPQKLLVLGYLVALLAAMFFLVFSVLSAVTFMSDAHNSYEKSQKELRTDTKNVTRQKKELYSSVKRTNPSPSSLIGSAAGPPVALAAGAVENTSVDHSVDLASAAGVIFEEEKEEEEQEEEDQEEEDQEEEEQARGNSADARRFSFPQRKSRHARNATGRRTRHTTTCAYAAHLGRAFSYTVP